MTRMIFYLYHTVMVVLDTKTKKTGTEMANNFLNGCFYLKRFILVLTGIFHIWLEIVMISTVLIDTNKTARLVVFLFH